MGDLLGPCGRHGARGHHVGDPWVITCVPNGVGLNFECQPDVARLFGGQETDDSTTATQLHQ